MGKSEVYKLFERNCPRAVQDEDAEMARSYESVVVFDMMIPLRNVGHSLHAKGGDEITLRSIIDRVFRDAVGQMLQTQMVVALFDKADFVTDAKAAEQEMRDMATPSSGEDLPDLWSCTDRDNADTVSAPGRDWGNLLNNREARVELVWRICEEFKSCMFGVMQEIGIPDGHTMLLDYQDRDRAPVVWEVSNRAATRASAWDNQLGEFDVAYLHYSSDSTVNELVQAVEDRTQIKQAVLVVSSDSDILPIEMLNIRAGNVDVHIRRTVGKPGVRRITFPKIAAVYIKEQMRHVASPIEDFALSFVLAGSDFVTGIPGVGNLKFIEARMQAGEHKSPFDVFRRLLENSHKKMTTTTTGRKRKRVTHAAALRASVGKEDARLSAVPCKQGGKPSKPFLDPTHAWARAKYIVNYWAHSVNDRHLQLSTCIGHGWHKDGLKTVVSGSGFETTGK